MHDLQPCHAQNGNKSLHASCEDEGHGLLQDKWSQHYHTTKLECEEGPHQGLITEIEAMKFQWRGTST